LGGYGKVSKQGRRVEVSEKKKDLKKLLPEKDEAYRKK